MTHIEFMSNANTTVRINGNIVFTGTSEAATARLIDALTTLRTPGDVISLRDTSDMTLSKVSVGDDGKLVDWLGNFLN